MKTGNRVRRLKQYQDNFPGGNNICIVTDWRIAEIEVSSNGHDLGWWDANRFEVIEEVPEYLEQFKNARKYIGKEMTYEGYPHKIENIQLIHKDDAKSIAVRAYCEKHEFCVIAEWNSGVSSAPFEDMTLLPDYKELQVGDYEAKIYSDKIVVGCQTIPISTVEEIVSLAKSL